MTDDACTERSGADEAVRQTGRRADGAERVQIVERMGGRGGKGADSRADGRTGPTRREHADG